MRSETFRYTTIQDFLSLVNSMPLHPISVIYSLCEKLYPFETIYTKLQLGQYIHADSTKIITVMFTILTLDELYPHYGIYPNHYTFSRNSLIISPTHQQQILYYSDKRLPVDRQVAEMIKWCLPLTRERFMIYLATHAESDGRAFNKSPPIFGPIMHTASSSDSESY